MLSSSRKTFLLIFLPLVLLASIQAQDGEELNFTEATLLTDLSNTLNMMAGADEFSGVVVIAHHGTIIFEGAYGYANRETETFNTLDTLFNLASMNKMFTSIAIAQLVEQNLLAYDVPVGQYLDNIPTEIAETITVHHLLTHTSGLVDYFESPHWADYIDETNTVSGYFPLFIDQPLRFSAGDKFEYANSNFIVLGAIIEAVSGQDYFDYVREHIYLPAEMLRTDTYTVDELPENTAFGYTNMTANGGVGIL